MDARLRALVRQRTPFRDPAATERARAGLPPYIDPPATAPQAPCPSRPGSRHAIQRHPQREQVIAAILAGESCRSIARWIDPPLSDVALSSFARSVVRPAVQKAEAITAAVESLTKPAPIVAPQNEVEKAEPNTFALPSHQTLESPQVSLSTNVARNPEPSRIPSQTLVRALLDADPVTASEVGKLAIASREGRVAELANRHRKLQEGFNKVLSERGVEVVKKTRRGSGNTAWESEEVRVDPGVVALASELLDHEKQAAQELGQWDAGGAPAVAIQIVVPAAPATSSQHDARIRRKQAVIDIDITGGRR